MIRNRKALILDRDGVLNKDLHYVYNLKDLKIPVGVIKGLKKFQFAGYFCIVITNQSGIGRGYYTLAQYQEFNRELFNRLGKQGIKIAAVYFCPHLADDNCDCRKPKAKMLLQAFKDFKLKPENCLLVGDKDADFFNKIYNYKTAWIKNDRYAHQLKVDYEVKSLDDLANQFII